MIGARPLVADCVVCPVVDDTVPLPHDARAVFEPNGRDEMTQNDLDNGRLICLVGVAPLHPAEFVIFRIGQKTAGARG